MLRVFNKIRFIVYWLMNDFSATLPVTIWQLSCQSKASVLGNLPSNVQRLVRIFFLLGTLSSPLWALPQSFGNQVAKQSLCVRQPPLNRSATESCQTNEPEIQPLVFGKPPLHCSAHPCLNCSATESCQTNMCSATLPPEPSGN